MKIWIIGLLSACMVIPVYTENHEREGDEREHGERFEEEDGGEKAQREHRDLEPLGKTLRLEFKALPEEDEEPLALVVATTDYGLAVEMEGADELFRFEVEGELILLDDDRLGLTFDLHLVIEGEEGKIMYSAHGSTISRIDGKAELATFGDKTLYVLVTEVE
jgi:hypothetical protein